MVRFDEAIAYFDKALAIAPDLSIVWYDRGRALHDSERYDRALSDYDRGIALRARYAIELEPENYWAWYQRGLVLSELGQMRRSLALTGRSTGNLIGSSRLGRVWAVGYGTIGVTDRLVDAG